MNIVPITRKEYLESVQEIRHFKSLKFLKSALDTWDNFFSWKQFPPLALKINNNIVCYLFYHVSKNNDYLTISNILTPYIYRKKGYAYKLLTHLFEILQNKKIKRCKLLCVNNSLHFYKKIGLTYWGVTKQYLYYSDFKMPKNINEIKKINEQNSTNEFDDKTLSNIYEMIKDNGLAFENEQLTTHKKNIKFLKNDFRFDEFKESIKKRIK